MTGKLRQVPEFEVARFQKNPGEMMRTLADGSHAGEWHVAAD